MNQKIKDITKAFKPISLQEMDEVSLMNRSDTKFLLPLRQTSEILLDVLNDYSVLEINQDRIMTYNSLYFDTPKHDFYLCHHNGKFNRIKVRIRNYVESKIHFLEVKRKNGKGITKKSRISLEGFERTLSEGSKKFVSQTTKGEFNLKPILENRFNRITLVSKANKERATLDFNLSFKNKTHHKVYNGLAIIEIKQEGVDRNSSIYTALKKRHILPYSISKYCLGMVSLYEGIKYNNFKQKLLKIQTLTA